MLTTYDIERIKLTAMYLNNLSVGVMLAGVFGPYFVLYHTVVEHHLAGSSESDAWLAALGGNWQGVIVYAAAFVAAIFLRWAASWELKKLKKLDAAPSVSPSPL